MRKRTKRKVYALVNPLAHAIEGATITPEAQLNQLRVRELAAIESFTRGVAGEPEWHDLNAMVGICRVMANKGIGPEAIEACDRAEEALRSDWNRYAATGKMGTSGTGLAAYRDAFAFHDLQRQSVSRAEYERHIRAAVNKVKFSKEKAA